MTALSIDPTKTVLILGAGFSHHIDQAMPLTHTVGEEVVRRVAGELFDVGGLSDAERANVEQGRIPYGDLEQWLTSLGAEQPYHNLAERHARQSAFHRVLGSIVDVLRECENAATRSGPPSWLIDLVVALHAVRSPVLTFNYDSLVEKTVSLLTIRGASRTTPGRDERVNEFSILGDLPTLHRGQGGGRSYSPLLVESFRLHKLHGSLTWFRNDTGVVRDDRLIGSWSGDPVDFKAPRADLHPMLVPPIADKSNHYSGSCVGAIWAEAARSLRDAQTVCLLGYSLPATDFSTASLLADNLQPGCSVVVVNPSAREVVERVQKILPGVEISRFGRIEDFVALYEERVVDYVATQQQIPLRDQLTVFVHDCQSLGGEGRRVVGVDGSTVIVGPPEGMAHVQPGTTALADMPAAPTQARDPDGKHAPLFGFAPSTFQGIDREFFAGRYR